MNPVKIGFFSFTEVTDPKGHRAYNEWHQLDHMPEQYPIPGIVWGQRWVSTPACRAARWADEPSLSPIHYMTCYLVSEPVERTLADFADLGAQLRGLGRFYRERRSHLNGPFWLLQTYAAARVLVSPEAIPFRPNRGVIVTVDDGGGLPSAERERVARYLHEVHFPEMLGVPGVAGIWSYQWRRSPHPAWVDASPEGRRITVYYLDEDPLGVARAFREHEAAGRASGRLEDLSKSLRPVFAGPLETVLPWKWDWFDE